MSKIYLSGRWSDREKIRDQMQKLIANGFDIVYDWTDKEIEPIPEHETLQKNAIRDLNGIKNCDLFIAWFDDPYYPYRGTCTELGAAIGLKKKILIIDSGTEGAMYRSNWFLHYTDLVKVKNWTEVYLWLVLDYWPSVEKQK